MHLELLNPTLMILHKHKKNDLNFYNNTYLYTIIIIIYLHYLLIQLLHSKLWLKFYDINVYDIYINIR